jgi:hypothetical protein
VLSLQEVESRAGFQIIMLHQKLDAGQSQKKMSVRHGLMFVAVILLDIV